MIDRTYLFSSLVIEFRLHSLMFEELYNEYHHSIELRPIKALIFAVQAKKERQGDNIRSKKVRFFSSHSSIHRISTPSSSKGTWHAYIYLSSKSREEIFSLNRALSKKHIFSTNAVWWSVWSEWIPSLEWTRWTYAIETSNIIVRCKYRHVSSHFHRLSVYTKQKSNGYYLESWLSCCPPFFSSWCVCSSAGTIDLRENLFDGRHPTLPPVRREIFALVFERANLLTLLSNSCDRSVRHSHASDHSEYSVQSIHYRRSPSIVRFNIRSKEIQCIARTRSTSDEFTSSKHAFLHNHSPTSIVYRSSLLIALHFNRLVVKCIDNLSCITFIDSSVILTKPSEDVRLNKIISG